MCVWLSADTGAQEEDEPAQIDSKTHIYRKIAINQTLVRLDEQIQHSAS